MQEYVSRALVLSVEPYREADVRVSLFTEKFGKVQARARSARKVTSKLSPHLQPGIFSRVRLVEKGGVQVVDALRVEKGVLPLSDLLHLRDLLPAFHPEEELWTMLQDGTFTWSSALRVLGWDPDGAACRRCPKPPVLFYIPDQEFFCRTHSPAFSSAGSHPAVET